MAALGARRDQQEQQQPAGPFTPGAPKHERQQALLASLHQAPPQARDERGRFAERPTGSASFDGGARAPVPGPPESHDAWLARALRTGAIDVGRRLG